MKCECRKCGYKWESRIGEPKACPKCKRYDWEENASDISSKKQTDSKGTS